MIKYISKQTVVLTYKVYDACIIIIICLYYAIVEHASSCKLEDFNSHLHMTIVQVISCFPLQYHNASQQASVQYDR